MFDLSTQQFVWWWWLSYDHCHCWLHWNTWSIKLTFELKICSYHQPLMHIVFSNNQNTQPYLLQYKIGKYKIASWQFQILRILLLWNMIRSTIFQLICLWSRWYWLANSTILSILWLLIWFLDPKKYSISGIYCDLDEEQVPENDIFLRIN